MNKREGGGMGGCEEQMEDFNTLDPMFKVIDGVIER